MPEGHDHHSDHGFRYEYNLDRQLTRILRPDGDTVRFTYDTAGRPQGVIRSSPELCVKAEEAPRPFAYAA
jgi:YD repeat-containing protein